MIGGTDIVLSNPYEPAYALAEAFRQIAIIWPSAVVENGETGESIDPDLPRAFDVHELLIYKNHAAQESWIRHGAIPPNSDSMVHLLVDSKRLTLVVHSETDRQVRAIGDAVRTVLAPSSVK